MKFILVLILIIFVTAQTAEKPTYSINDFEVKGEDKWVNYAVSSVYSDLECLEAKTTVPLLLNHCLLRPHGMEIELLLIENEEYVDMYFCTIDSGCTQCQLGSQQEIGVCKSSDVEGEVWSENFELERKRKGHLQYVEKFKYTSEEECEGDYSSDAYVLKECFQYNSEYSYQYKYNKHRKKFIYKQYSDLECEDFQSAVAYQEDTCYEIDGVHQTWQYGVY
ncbi:hypothetical protein M0812_06190 [Anaeramoeba flamelloides]|uniref:Uncharacterized protein n=1 Tax=Anaeramoeba flamelloides TaxID=1746091 RepID=A0AAV8A873_9EUKA|nr:hypothetical protein M0812_06190 [Anaeramoeba flamelloides]